MYSLQKLRGLNFIDPEDVEFKETMKHARKKLELPMEAAVFCEVKHCGESDTRKSKYACTVKAHESTRTRIGKHDKRS